MKTNFKMAAALVALLMAFSVNAQPVLERDAQYAAKGWSILNARAFKALGGDVESVTAETNAVGKVQWYVVKMSSGAAIVAPDDEIEPIIAVLPGSDGIIPSDSPLRAILVRDMANRLARVSGKLRLTTSSALATTSDETSKWNKLRQYGRGRVLTTSAASKTPAKIVRWLDGWNSPDKVGNVQTLRFWNQDNSTDYFTNPSIFNLYTPGNAYCGCVATAGSSVMHYFRVPSGNVLTRECTYNGAKKELTTKGGNYDWSLVDGLNLKNGSRITLSENAVDLLGRVAYDCGVGCQMDYGDDGSGSYTVNLMHSFRDVFNVQNAQLVTKGGGEHGYGEDYDIGPQNYANIIYNQIRGGAPVVMGIDGHEVVACGYGYDADRTDYTYVFLGWGSANDAWYALPNIDTKATAEGGWYTSTFVDELITEIAPFDDKFVAVVGQVVDADGEPVADDPVTLGNGEVVKTDANGFFGTRVSPDDPCYVIDSFGEEHEYTIGAAATTTTAGGMASGALAAAMPDAMVIELLEPAVRVGGDDNRVYGSLTKALQEVRSGETVEILKPTVFKKSVVVTNDCTIFATNAIPAEAFIRHINGAVMTVTNGVTVTISNVCFQAERADVMFDVTEGGKLNLGSNCQMGAIAMADANGLVVADALTDSLYVSCTDTMKEGDIFAMYTTDYETATNCVHFLRHPTNTRLGGEADENGNIFWSRKAPVADDIAVAKTVIGGVSKNYLAMDDIIEDISEITDPVEIVALKDGTITKKCTLKSSSATIRGEGAEKPVLATATTAGFVIGANTALTLTNVTFVGTQPKDVMSEIRFIKVDGGALTLEDGAEITGFTGRVKEESGVIDLLGGTATMKTGAIIANCQAKGSKGAGGAIYVDCNTTCTLNLEGGTITNCCAQTYGGGVYVNNPSGYAPTVKLSGTLILADNRAGSDISHADDIYLRSAKSMAKFKLVGALGAGSRVGVLYGSGASTSNDKGNAFITNELGDAVDPATLYAFFSDANANRIAAKGTGDKAGMLVWADDPRDPRQCDESEATAKLIGGIETTFWREVSDALNAATNNCIVEVIARTEYVPLSSTITINGTNVTLRSETDAAAANKLLRGEDVQIIVPVGAGLVVTNLAFCGNDSSSETVITNTVTLFDVRGGTLRMRDAAVRDILGYGKRDANAITVSEQGVLDVSGDVQINACYNLSVDPTEVKKTNAGAGGGILVDNATAYFRDMSVSQCLATWGGGVFACNGATVYLCGATSVDNNLTPDYASYSNLQLSDTATLILDGELTGLVGMTCPEYSLEHPGVTNVVATVSPTWTWDVTALTNSAASFERDLDGELAVAVTNDTKALIVWCGAVQGGVYTNGADDVYYLAGEMPTPSEKANPEPPAAPETTTITILNVKPVDGSLAITVLATEGGNAVALATEQATGLFEATTDLGDWTTKKVDLTVESSIQNPDGTMTFTVKPSGNPNTAFIRLAQ